MNKLHTVTVITKVVSDELKTLKQLCPDIKLWSFTSKAIHDAIINELLERKKEKEYQNGSIINEARESIPEHEGLISRIHGEMGKLEKSGEDITTK